MQLSLFQRVCKCGQPGSKGGRCRPCSTAYARRWRSTGNGKASGRASDVRTGRAHTDEAVLGIILTSLIREHKNAQEKSQRLFAAADQKDQRDKEDSERLYSRAFLQKIFQPCVCIDCGQSFESLQPFVVKRCRPCQNFFRLANHGGGPRRRCKTYGVPYEAFNVRLIFEAHNWKCQLCGTETPESKRGTFEPNAPELDHIWALSAVRDDVKSPGHVKSNCQLLCRKCNGEKRTS